MAVCKVAFPALFSIFILNLKKSDGFCESDALSTHFTRCEFLEDLYNYKGSSELIDVNPGNRSNLQELRPIHIPNAAAVKDLRLTSVIDKFKSEDFKDLVNLNKLTLRDNVLYNISKPMFDGLKIRHLILDHCHINNIETGAFTGLSEIQVLSLIGNNIPNIKRGIFDNLTLLRILGLTKNRITNIEKGAFKDLPNLTRIYLSGNFLKQFFVQDHLTFEYLPKLKLILIRDGIISEISAYMLEGLTNLQYLDLRSNNISSIGPLAFGKTLKLKQLYLSNNKLQELDGSIFPQQGLPSLTYINLRFNRLTFLSTTFLQKLKGLKFISIGGNPWQCKCLDILQNWMATQKVDAYCDEKFFDGSRPICVMPENGNSCVYRNDPQLYTNFQNVISFYNKTDNC